MTHTEQAVLAVVLAAIIGWAVLGPGGWFSGVVGAGIGVAVALILVARRRRRQRHPDASPEVR